MIRGAGGVPRPACQPVGVLDDECAPAALLGELRRVAPGLLEAQTPVAPVRREPLVAELVDNSQPSRSARLRQSWSWDGMLPCLSSVDFAA